MVTVTEQAAQQTIDKVVEERGRRTLVTGGDPEAAVVVPSESEFFGADFMEAPQLAKIGEALIDHWPEFEHLRDVEIRYLWKRKAGKNADKLVGGKCQKVSGLTGFLAGVPWVVYLAADCWRDVITNYQLEALVYHELCHAGAEEDEKTGDLSPVVVGHDIEMFHDEVRRYGLWKAELRAAHETFTQLSLLAS